MFWSLSGEVAYSKDIREVVIPGPALYQTVDDAILSHQ